VQAAGRWVPNRSPLAQNSAILTLTTAVKGALQLAASRP